MSGIASALAMIATSGATLLVLLVFAPSLQASFVVPKFAALELTSSLGLVAFALHHATTGRPRWTRSVTVGALLVMATSALAWVVALGRPLGTPYGIAAMARWGSLFGVACGASVLGGIKDARQRALEAVTFAAGSVAVLGLLQHIEIVPFPMPIISTPGSTFGNRNIAAEVMAMALPLGLGAAAGARRWEARAVMFVGLALELMYLVVTRTRGAWVGATCGLGVALWLTQLRWRDAARYIALGAIAVAIVGVSLPRRFNPRDTGDRKRYSAVVEVMQQGFDRRSTALKTRFGLWRRTLDMLRDQPLLGVGPGNWPVVFPRYAEPGASRDGVLSASLAPRQAHNDFLERAAETGVAGLAALGVLMAGAVISVRRWLRTSDEDALATTAAAAGALVALLSMSVASFPLDMPGTLMLGGLALGLVATDARRWPAPEQASVRPTPPGVKARAIAYAGAAAGLVLLGCAAVRAERSVRSSQWLATAEGTMHRAPGLAGAQEAIEALSLAVAATPHDFRVQLRLAQALLSEHRSVESARAARRALAVEPYSPNALAALAAAELDAGDHQAARKDASAALSLLHDFPFALQVRATAAEQEVDLPAADADRQRLSTLAAGAEDDPTARTARELLQREN